MQNSRYFSIFRKQTEDPLISISAMKQTQSVLKRRKWTLLHLSLLVEQDKKKVSHCEAALATIQCKFSSLGGTHSSCLFSPFNAWNCCSLFTSQLKRRRTFSSLTGFFRFNLTKKASEFIFSQYLCARKCLCLREYECECVCVQSVDVCLKSGSIYIKWFSDSD